MCWRRALETFQLPAETWGVNVQGRLVTIIDLTGILIDNSILWVIGESLYVHRSDGARRDPSAYGIVTRWPPVARTSDIY
jgi:hypothetical protein